MNVVVDTSTFVSALLSGGSASRRIIRSCFRGEIKPLMGNALYSEYDSLVNRDSLFEKTPLSQVQRNEFLDDFLSVCSWVDVYYLWRPNLQDEADNHVMELAVAGGAEAIITENVKDFKSMELLFPDIRIYRGHEFLERKD